MAGANVVGWVEFGVSLAKWVAIAGAVGFALAAPAIRRAIGRTIAALVLARSSCIGSIS